MCFCSKSPECWGSNKDKGIIEESPEFHCFPYLQEEKVVIDSEADFRHYFDSTDCEQPAIDFTRHTLLGFYGEGQCSVKYIRKVERDEENKLYRYTLKIRSCGLCKKLAISYNWVIVPKLPLGWTVEFVKIKS